MIWTDDGTLEIIKDEQSYGIFFDTGVGKTALLLALIDYKFFNENVKRVLVITPKKVSISTWQKEIAKWDNFRYMSNIVQLIDQDEDKRLTKLRDTGEFSIHIISSSLVQWLNGETEVIERISKRTNKPYTVKKFHPNLDRPDYDMIVVDECSQFKTPSSERFKALDEIIRSKKGDPMKLFLLSGTPFSNIRLVEEKRSKYYVNVEELYYIFYFLGIYVRSKYDFEQDFTYTKKYDQYHLRTSIGVYEALEKSLEYRCLRKKLVLNIKKNEYKIYVPVDKEKMDDLIDYYVVQTNNLTTVTAQNRAIMINKALQLSNGFVYDEFKTVHRFNKNKMDKLIDLLSVINDNVVIVYQFKEDRELILSSIEGVREYESKQDEDDWNAGLIRYLLLSPDSDRFGLNLQFGGHTIVWYGLTWSGEAYKQTNARLYRRGQEKNVDVYYIMGEESFDDYVFDVVMSKSDAIADFIDYVRRKTACGQKKGGVVNHGQFGV